MDKISTPNDADKNFATQDLVLASFLRYNDIQLVSGYQIESKSWVFSNIEKCEELELDLKNGNAQVEPLSYESCRRNLLGMVYDKKNVSRRNN
jgi:hypothetical protein